MSAFVLNNSKEFQYSWAEKLARNAIRYGCSSRPKHIAIVMDGNRRFARERRVERAEGHNLGAEKLFQVCQWCFDLGINELSVYAFSLENSKRSEEEIETLMNIAREKLKQIEMNLDRIHQQKISIRIIGNIDLLPDDIQQSSYRLMKETRDNENFVLNVCLYYTSRDEITKVIRDLSRACEKNLITPDDIDENLITQSLIVSASRTSNFPEIFLRTSGEVRLSDFMLFQCRFSMWIFADVFWPAFTIWHLFWIVLQFEMNAKTFNKILRNSRKILQENSSSNEEKSRRIENYLDWLKTEKSF